MVARTRFDINMTTGGDCATQSEVKSSRDEKKQEYLSTYEDSTHSIITQENTNSKSEEMKETKVDDAPVNVGEQSKYSCEQGLDEETKTEKQKPRATECRQPVEANSEDLTGEVKNKQGEDIIMEELKGDEVEHKRNVSDRDPDDDENTQMGHSEEDEGQIRKSLKKEALSLQARGEEGDAESVKIDISVEETSHDINMTTGGDCATQSKLINSGDEEAQKYLSTYEDSTHSSITQENTNELKEDDAPLDLREKTAYCREQRLDEEKKTDKKKQRGSQPQKRHYGLYNQGATCYLSSVLQVLFMTTEIHDRLDPEFQTDLQLRNVFEDLKKNTCGTESITKSLEIQNVYQQCDAAECLELILRKIGQRASEVFQGELRYTTKCSKGHSINEEIKTFSTLPLSLKDTHDTTYNLERSFERTFESKSFTGDNKVYCNICNKKTEATRRWEMVKSPQILTLLLKRFDFDYNTMSHVKSNCCVDVPRELQRETYKLYGMVNHMGSLKGGHYTATILSDEDKTWYDCNDAHVNKVEEQPFAKSRTYNSGTVYLLMYRATECRQPVEANSEDLTGEVKNKQGEDIIMEELKGDEVEHKRNVSDRDRDDDENTQMGHSEEDEGQIRKSLKKEALSLQARGEEGDAESVKIDISVEETSHDINMTTGGDCATQSKLINSGDEEAQKYLSTYEDSTHSIITQENTNSKSEEMKETKVDDAPVNVGEQSKYSCEQGLDEETKTEKQKPRATECRQPVEANSEDLTGEVKNKQGEDIIMEELKGDEVEHKRNVSDRDPDDDENTQMGHSEEDEDR
ncbi:ubiquitin carboxyl-terminal hydrolase 17-like [Siniperca chuatsi]|uniref:ubiquitin carboxyl-terminal hydrolase 17-like n=1 Tax=Siniperca chuatsi TaxID=119488 RepID=UPI001CE0471D|nr:ubiquitin carboxyl-terminal hydrolase 17-like [Siniperca chuatsi]